jgi:hypothetical protein
MKITPLLPKCVMLLIKPKASMPLEKPVQT